MKEHDFAGALKWLPYSKRLNQPAGGATVWYWLEKYHNEIEHALTLAKKMQNEGNVVVPREATREMLAPWCGDIYEYGQWYWDPGDEQLEEARKTYKAMIQAAMEGNDDQSRT